MEKITAGKVSLKDERHPFWGIATRSSAVHFNATSDCVFIDVSYLLHEDEEHDDDIPQNEGIMELIRLLDQTPAFEGWREVEVLFVL